MNARDRGAISASLVARVRSIPFVCVAGFGMEPAPNGIQKMPTSIPHGAMPNRCVLSPTVHPR
jgi:hypothetical protein